MGDIGWQEILVVLMIALLLYGKNLPQVARKVGNTYGNFKRKLSDVRANIEQEIRNADSSIDAAKSDLDMETNVQRVESPSNEKNSKNGANLSPPAV